MNAAGVVSQVEAPAWTPEQLVGPGRCVGCGERLPEVRRAHRLTCGARCRKRWQTLRDLPYHEAAARAWGFQPSDCWRTPPEVVGDAAERLRVKGFQLDASSLPLDAVAPRCIPPWEDGRERPWGPGPTWCNPPYSRAAGGLEPWARKAWREAKRGVPVALLLPASVGATWFRDLLEEGATCVLYEGRINFLPPPGMASGGARHDSALFLFGKRLKPGIVRAPRPSGARLRLAGKV